jgi:hypothetical protein
MHRFWVGFGVMFPGVGLKVYYKSRYTGGIQNNSSPRLHGNFYDLARASLLIGFIRKVF